MIRKSLLFNCYFLRFFMFVSELYDGAILLDDDVGRE
jgi:hypothetical protein